MPHDGESMAYHHQPLGRSLRGDVDGITDVYALDGRQYVERITRT